MVEKEGRGAILFVTLFKVFARLVLRMCAILPFVEKKNQFLTWNFVAISKAFWKVILNTCFLKTQTTPTLIGAISLTMLKIDFLNMDPK